MISVTLTKTQKGRYRALYNNNYFNMECQKENTVYWYCANKKTKDLCRCRIITNPIVGLSCSLLHISKVLHNHEDNNCRINAKTEISGLVKENVFQKTSGLILKVHANCLIVDSLPSDKSIKERINYQKRKLFPNAPKFLSEVDSQMLNYSNINDEKFLLHLSENHDLLILGTINNFRRLTTSNRLMADGTFSIVPKIYMQMYTLMAQIYDTFYPLLYVFMSRKNEEAYDSM